MAKNLLRDIGSEEEIREILARHPRRPLLPQAGARAWKDAARHPLLNSLVKSVRARAIEEAEEPLPALTDELHGIYHRTGSRWEFETVYFERRRRVARAALALLFCDDTNYARTELTASVLEKLAGILEESSWAFPAHVKDSSGKDPFTIDLFCAETANLMAELLDLLGGLVPGDLRQRIHDRLVIQIWGNYLEQDFFWVNYGNNWNAVCHQGVLGSALSALDDDDLLARMLFKASRGLPVFLAGFGADGGSSEGPGYWDYGFGWFAALNEQLEARTEGELSLFAGDSHILEIARFGPRCSLSGGNLTCFADSAPKGILRPANLLYLGERLGDSLCREQGLANYAATLEKELDLDHQRVDLFFLTRFILRCPESLPEKSPEPTDKDVYLPNLAVVIAAGRDTKGHLWEFAAKAGHNEEHHNHNDCGSYLLNLDGVPFITEIGAPRYDRDFFRLETRYQNLAARTLGHSLPIVNGCEQMVGRDYAASVIDYSNTAEATRFVVDLTKCYPVEAACRKLVRTFIFEKATGRLSVRDEFDLVEAREAETAIMTTLPVKEGKNFAAISGGKLRLMLHFDTGTELGGVQRHSYLLHDPKITEPALIHRIVLKPTILSTRFSLGFTAVLD